MKFFMFFVFLFVTQFSIAGTMKEIDYITRETVANQYYLGDDNEGYLEYMFNEIWDLELKDGIENKCLVITTGIATTYFNGVGMNRFWVCINKLENGEFTAYLLSDQVETGVF
jgi:hypothetical protein